MNLPKPRRMRKVHTETMTVANSESPRTDFTAAMVSEIARLRPLAELGRMAATVAHEVRNPLAGISANAELLREALHAADDIESVDIILTEVDRLSSLVTDLLLYTRERPPRHDPIDLADVARSACELSQQAADRDGVRLYWRFKPVRQTMK